MSCPHASTTTVAFLYGEAPDAHALHVASCAECAAVLDDHEAVAVVLGPTLSAVRPRTRAARRFPLAAVGAGVLLAMAATALLAVRSWTPSAPDPVAPPPDDGFDVAIDALDLELAELELELL